MLLNCGVEEDWLLRVPWTARRSSQTILKEISPEYSLEGLILKLKLQYFGHLIHWKRLWCWGRLKAGEGDDRGWDGWMASPTRWRWVWVNSGNWWWTGKPGVLQSMGSQRARHDWATELTYLTHLILAYIIIHLWSRYSINVIIILQDTETHRGSIVYLMSECDRTVQQREFKLWQSYSKPLELHTPSCTCTEHTYRDRVLSNLNKIVPNSVCVYFAFIHNSILGSARHGGKGELKLVVSFQLQ